MKTADRIAALETRLAAAEARIALLEARPVQQPPPMFWKPLYQPVPSIPCEPNYFGTKVWCGNVGMTGIAAKIGHGQ